MQLKTILTGLGLFCVAVIVSVPAFSQEKEKAWYVGSDKCQECHMDEFNDWQSSGHPWKLRKVEKARYSGLPLPKGYLWEDISYVIGGANKKARFIDKNGYIVTSAKDGSPSPTQYNLNNGTWSNYHPGEKKPYKCGPCHMTAYSSEGHQSGLPGMIGTWKEDGVGCEECHGPGSTHTYQIKPTKDTIKTDRSGESCGKCHQRGGMAIPPLAKGGFVRHHEQFNEVNIGGHGGTDCTECHNPHKRAINIKVSCVSCHDDDEAKDAGLAPYSATIHGRASIDCIECHMPKATKSAIKTGKFVGDVRSHMIKISVDPKADMFRPGVVKGKKVTFSKGFVTLDYACLGCHGSRDMNWAAKNAKGQHKQNF